MPVNNNKNNVYKGVKANIDKTVLHNKEQLAILHKKLSKIEKRPPQKFFYHSVEKKSLRQTIITESVKVLVTTLVAILVTRMVKKERN